jgi:hypothetical protein
MVDKGKFCGLGHFAIDNKNNSTKFRNLSQKHIDFETNFSLFKLFDKGRFQDQIILLGFATKLGFGYPKLLYRQSHRF